MEKNDYPLQTILDTLTKTKGSNVKKRLIFDQSPLGGIGSKWVIAFFISLPILLYVGIFNDAVFAMLGIAQAIIFYVVFLSMVMIMIVALAFINNNKVLREIKPSWNHYFPDVDIKWILSSGATPYKAFLNYYNDGLAKNLESDALYAFLQEAVVTMGKENATLLEMMSHPRR